MKVSFCAQFLPRIELRIVWMRAQYHTLRQSSSTSLKV
jgi:hypothetical protein